MWHEARKQERLIRGMIVDYRRRAERRKDFYEKIKAEPTQFLQLHGRQCKIHLDPAIAIAGEGPAIMMPWQGDTTNLIDRFDVRAHLDYIPEVKNKDVPPEELEQEERQCNYERYRILAQNAFLGIGEDKFLQQLAIEEQFGVTIEEKEAQKERLHEKKGTGAAIGYNYNDPGAQPSCSNGPESKNMEQEDSDDDSDLDIIDVDLSIDVNKMEASQAHELNAVGPQYGMAGCDLFSFLTGDADDAEHQKQLLREEKEKAMFSGRKSRRERRAHRDKKLATRVMSPPSYAAPRAPSRSRSGSRSQTRSPEPDASTSIQFITSFGDDDDQPSIPSKPLYADKVKQNLKKKELLYSDVARLAKSRSPKSNDRRNYRQIGPHRPTSVSKSRSRSRSRSKPRIWKKTRSQSRSYSRSRSNSSRSRSKSNSYSPRRRSISRSRSGSRSNNYGNNRSHSPQNNSSKGYAKHIDSRSMLHESNDKGGVNKVIPRYYGRRKEDKSSSELSLDSDSSGSSDEEKNETAVSNKLNTNQNQLRLSGSSSKGPSRETLTLKEKLKRKMQAQIARQLRADKKAEAERLERESRRQARRDEEMRELAIKLRRKQREIRHRQYRRSSGDDSDRSRSGSPSRESQLKKKEPSRSKSKSPELPRPQKSPVRETKQDTSVRSKNFNLENYSRKRPDNSEHYRNERKIDEDRSFFKHDRHSKHERYDNRSERDYGDRYDGRSEREYGERFESRSEHQQRWEHQDNYHSRGQRRPFGHRGGYREHSRYGHDQSYRDGPSSWSSRKDFRDSYDRESTDEYSRGKVKLVDY